MSGNIKNWGTLRRKLRYCLQMGGCGNSSILLQTIAIFLNRVTEHNKNEWPYHDLYMKETNKNGINFKVCYKVAHFKGDYINTELDSCFICRHTFYYFERMRWFDFEMV